MTKPAAIVAPPYLNINLPSALKSLNSSTHIGLLTSISTIALVFLVKHLKRGEITTLDLFDYSYKLSLANKEWCVKPLTRLFLNNFY